MSRSITIDEICKKFLNASKSRQNVEISSATDSLFDIYFGSNEPTRGIERGKILAISTLPSLATHDSRVRDECGCPPTNDSVVAVPEVEKEKLFKDLRKSLRALSSKDSISQTSAKIADQWGWVWDELRYTIDESKSQKTTKEFLPHKKKGRSKNPDSFYGKKTPESHNQFFKENIKTNNVFSGLLSNSKKFRNLVLTEDEIYMKDLTESVVSEFTEPSDKKFAKDIVGIVTKDSSFNEVEESIKLDALIKGSHFGLKHYKEKITSELPCEADSLILSIIFASPDTSSDSEVEFVGFFYHAPHCKTPVRTYAMLTYCGLSLINENIESDYLAECNEDSEDFCEEKLQAYLKPLVSKLLTKVSVEQFDESSPKASKIDDLEYEDIFGDKDIPTKTEEILKNVIYCPIRMSDSASSDVEVIKDELKRSNALTLAEKFNSVQLEIVKWVNMQCDSVLTSYIDEYAKRSLMMPSYRSESLKYGKFEALRIIKEQLLSKEKTGIDFGSW